MNDNLLAVPILVPLICALFLVILHRQVRLSRRIALGALLISFIRLFNHVNRSHEKRPDDIRLW